MLPLRAVGPEGAGGARPRPLAARDPLAGVFVEGAGGNLRALRAMAQSSKNPNAHFFEVKNANHFSVLAPTNRLIADRILQDTGPICRLEFSEEEVNKPFAK